MEFCLKSQQHLKILSLISHGHQTFVSIYFVVARLFGLIYTAYLRWIGIAFETLQQCYLQKFGGRAICEAIVDVFKFRLEFFDMCMLMFVFNVIGDWVYLKFDTYTFNIY
eukprot:TRINITY_DN10833_c0_g1_i3.p3 TRINITY_DN10833_c0_g1~~TRINITY_DN10833_c0_g1_i3.p3  ORF type:complete len:110 (+),score=2.09 TRINITY_DN10833_c0_g1_i3:247-576(+)